MLKILILLGVTILIFILTTPAYCSTTVFHISATIPEHVMTNNIPGVNPFPQNLNQSVQTETVIRNNHNIQMTTIVVQ